MKYYKYKNKIYKFIDYAVNFNEETRDLEPVVVYTDGKLMFCMRCDLFYERFSEVRYDSLEDRSWEL